MCCFFTSLCTHFFAGCWWEAIAGMGSAYTNSGGVDELVFRVQVAESQVVEVPEIWFWVVKFVDLVVV